MEFIEARFNAALIMDSNSTVEIPSSSMASSNTLGQYDTELGQCREIFEAKVRDYGTSWRIMRPIALTDQLYIKARRIRTLQEGAERKIDEGVEGEFQGIVNYAIIALIQLELGWHGDFALSEERVQALYKEKAAGIRELMQAKNHDYGEAWRDMRVEGITDLILTKLLRVRTIEANGGRVEVSEGIDSHYSDMANYALFALILLSEQEQRA